MYGNFEKYLINRNGQVVAHYKNGALLNQNFENNTLFNKPNNGAGPAHIERKIICDQIETELAK